VSFLDEIISDSYGQISEMTRRRLEYMISNAMIISEERSRLERKSSALTEEEAEQIIKSLQDQMPIMGLHRWPLDMKETKQAIRYQVDKDDLHELRFKK
jgi:hypothetical protein